jgi:subtilisin family serine protease
MTNTKQLVAAVMVALILASSVLAGLPIADADTPDWDIDRQNPATVAIADRLQPAEGEVTVIARLETPRVMSSTDGMSTKQRLKSHAETSQSDLVAFADRAAGVNVVQRFWLGNAVLLEVNTSRTGLMEVASIQGVERLHPNYEFEIPAPRSGSTEGGGFGQTVDQLASSDGHAYGLEQLSVPDVWQDFGTKGGGTNVAVLDTGVQADHPAIELYTRDESDPTYPGGWAEFDDDGNRVSGSTPHDTGWHGTHTSGTVAGQNVSGVPVFGVAPNAKLMNGLVLSGGNGTFAQIIGGMQWAVEEDADVVSLSMGTLLDPNSDVDLPVSSYLIDPIRDARAAGTYVVVASGNDGNETITSPGGIYDATSIGASDSNREIATFSSGGVVVPNDVWKEPPSDWPSEYVYPDVSAPGVNILSSVPDDGDSTYGYASGTSMAAPHVAGVVALLHSAAENRPSPGEIDTALTETATKPSDALSSKDTRYGEGIVDAYGAVSEVADAPTSSVGVSVSPSRRRSTSLSRKWTGVSGPTRSRSRSRTQAWRRSRTSRSVATPSRRTSLSRRTARRRRSRRAGRTRTTRETCASPR